MKKISAMLAVLLVITATCSSANAGLLTGAAKGLGKGVKSVAGCVDRGVKGVGKGVKSTFGGIGKGIKSL